MNEISCRLHVPSKMRSTISALLDQQFWLLGCDVRYFGGNLLLEMGFERLRPPADWKAATQYSLPLPAQGCLRLWGFGLWHSPKGSAGVLVRRSEFAPRLCTLTQPIWKLEDLPSLRMPVTVEEVHQVWSGLIFMWDWFASYERWVVQRCGVDYRREAWLQWNKKRIGEPDRLADCWRQAAEETRLLLSNLVETSGEIEVW